MFSVYHNARFNHKYCIDPDSLLLSCNVTCRDINAKGALTIRRLFSLVEMITNTTISNRPSVFLIGVV